MTNKAQYKFKLTLGSTGNRPAANVGYSILANGKILAKGKTTGTGETDVFELTGSTSVNIQIFNAKMNRGKGGYLNPSLHDRNAAAILLNNRVLDQISQVQNRPISMSNVLQRNTQNTTQTPLMMQPQPTIQTVQLRLKSYVIVELRDHLKRAFNTRLNYDVLDQSGTIIKQNNRELKGLRTERAGLTQIHFVEHPVRLRFYGGDLGSVKVTTEVVSPFFTHQDVLKTQYVKTAPAITAPKIDNTTRLAGKQDIPVIVDPKTNEIYVLSPQDFKDFLEISGSLTSAMKNVHERRENVNTLMALEAKTPEQIREAEKSLGIAQDDAIKALNQRLKNQADIREVIAFEMFTTSDGKQKLNAVRKYTNESQHIKNKNNRLNKFQYQLTYQVPWKNASDTAKTGHKDGTLMTIDGSQFKENLVQTMKDINVELIKVKGGTSVTYVPDPNIFGINATELVESYQTSESSTVDVQAQWLRLIAGAGYDGTVKWGTKGFQAQGSAYAQAKMVLLEGKKKWLWAYPSLKGWIMEADGVPMGAIRFICGAEIYGFSGAVFAASTAFAVTVSNDGSKQMLTSIAKDPNDSLSKRLNSSGRSVLAMKKGKMDDTVSPDNQFNAGINAFAGIQASISPFGGLQWLDPENPRDFSDLAKISPTLGLSAGIGGSADFQLYYAKGAFRFKASIAACYGVGGKGALEFMVDFKNIYQLVRFVAYQLTYVTFKKLVYMLHDDFILLHKISMMLPFEEDGAFIRSMQLIDDKFDKFKLKMQKAEQRIAMCRKINEKGQWLKYLSPESRGCFLYHITRHGLLTRWHDRTETEGWRIIGTDKEYDFPEHKEAVLNLFRSVTVVNHWTNTLQHMSPDGERSTKSIAENESELLDFLNLGRRMQGILPLADLKKIKERINQDHNFPENYSSGNKYIDEYLKMRGQRILAYPKDYQIANFGTQEFKQIQLAQHLEKPEIFIAQAPQPIEELDITRYTETDTKTWIA
ncbi:ATPase involved in DNA repair [Acinetobacter haemolyticus CIP 64.3 = MTCC 9819]|uniref:Uncharacterized protein n=1 Tax=Acinetobacter haemolyticus CIP 64.3 = MTCC 9819 TaxID=1217659 RepID=N9F431_ACIHA|nr:DUF4200 domain-containing protein [Acinetobacter haemolyticus]ENW17593.1 hypothetical protein F927_01947 [Acinetobacter haemolyticus CIP 64.3 = MTCC 9819]EPR90141.1 ATPase involved in DNA repair [Acinetobacter haemolyticus CIP 64.3 = MTCC 9819]QXZ25590.1 DUF4200 domain-containing protein [Acinetobacter haemolyticus]SPT47147.1 Uncharacterised protein [Acinetobacter haemolyticus]SUU57410.1 Uncharacterised protein [Acinetobacter haemolyticus]